MRVVFVGKKEKNTKPENIVFGTDSLILLGYGYLPEISLDDELRGDTNYIKILCTLSYKYSLLFLATATIYCGQKKFFGTIVIDKGKFLGISDMTHSAKSDYDKSNTLRVFETSMGRFGVISGEDINYFEVSRLMKLWECDCLFFGSCQKLTRKNKILAEAQGYINETTSILFCSDGMRAYNYKASTKRDTATFNIISRSENGLIDSRRREMYRDLVIR